MSQLQSQAGPRKYAHSVRANIGGVGAVYFAQGLGYATMMTALPSFADEWGLSETSISLILLATCLLAAAGSVLADFVASRYSSRRAVSTGFAMEAVALTAIALAPSFGVYLAAVFVYGVGLGTIDASQNMQGVSLERRTSSPLLGRFYAAATVATISGALIVSGSIKVTDGPLIALLVAAALAAIVSVGARFVLEGRAASAVAERAESPLATRAAGGEQEGVLPPGAEMIGGEQEGAWPLGADAPSDQQKLPLPKLGFSVFGAVGLVVLGTYLLDSAVSSWSTMYLSEGLAAAASVAPLGYALYQGTVLVARLFTDFLELRFGRGHVARAAVILGVVAAAIIAFVPTIWGAILGFGLAGLSTGALIPIAFSAAGSLMPERSDEVIARVNLFNYAGALLGAVLLGLVASGRGLGFAFLIPGIGLLLVLPLIKSLSRKNTITQVA